MVNVYKHKQALLIIRCYFKHLKICLIAHFSMDFAHGSFFSMSLLWLILFHGSLMLFVIPPFLFLFSNAILVIRAGIHKMLVRLANRYDPDQTASSEAV